MNKLYFGIRTISSLQFVEIYSQVIFQRELEQARYYRLTLNITHLALNVKKNLNSSLVSAYLKN